MDLRQKRQKRADAGKVISRLRKFLSEKSFLERHSNEGPFRVLISTIISQRTRDENTETASSALFARYPTVQKIAAAKRSEIEKLIRPSGFYRQKAKEIKEVCKILIEKYRGKVPRSRAELETLPGVGPKTSGCVLVYGFGIPAIPVDTHVFRISHRLGLVGRREKTPEKVEKALMGIFEKKDWLYVNEYLVVFGQNICKPGRPLCEACPLNDFCPTGKRILSGKN